MKWTTIILLILFTLLAGCANAPRGARPAKKKKDEGNVIVLKARIYTNGIMVTSNGQKLFWEWPTYGTKEDSK